MDMTTLKTKTKKAKNRIIGFVRDHWKEIAGGAVLIGVGLWISSQPFDEENESVNEYDYNFDSYSTSCIKVDEIRDSQICKRTDTPKRFIGDIDTTGSRLKRNEKQFLEALSAQPERFKGKEQTVESEFTDWCSDGKYTRHTKTKHIFGNDNLNIIVVQSYEDDDGQSDSQSTKVELKARNIINYFKENKDLKIFDDVRDIVDLL